MKKLIKYLLLGLIFFIPTVKAAGGLGVSPTSVSIVNGSSGSVTVCMNNAAGRVDFTASGPISISTTSEFLDAGCITLTISGNSNGSGTVSVRVIDGTTYDDEDVTGQSATIYVNVYTPSTPPSNPNPPSGNNNTGGGGNTKPTVLSGDASLASVTVSTYEVTKDGNNYLVTVPSDVEKVALYASTTQFKATVTGTGEKTLVPGENKFTLTVTAPNGNVTTYTVIITRKTDYFELSYLEEALKLENVDNINIKLKQDDILTVDMLDLIKDSNRNVNLFVYDEEDNLLYEWIIDTKSLDYEEEFNPILLLDLENKEDILSKINYVESIIFEVQTKVPTGIKLRFNINSKYKSSDTLASYKFVNNEAKLNGSNKDKVKNFGVSNTGFYEMVPDDKGIYIISKGNLLKSNDSTVFNRISTITDKKYIWVSIGEGIVILGLIGFIIFKFIIKNPKKALVSGETSKKKKQPKLSNTKKEKIEYMVPGVVPPEPVKEKIDNKKETVKPKEEPKKEEVKEENIKQVIVAPVVDASEIVPEKEEEIDIDGPVDADDMPELDIPLVIVPPKVPGDDAKEEPITGEVSDKVVANTEVGENINPIKLDTLDEKEKKKK